MQELSLDRSFTEVNSVKPASWIDSPSQHVTITEGESVNFVVGAEHDEGELHGVAWYIDDSYEEATYDLSGSWDTDDWSQTFDEPGTYTVEADVFDIDENYNHEAAEWTVTVEEEETIRPDSWADDPSGDVTITEGESVNFVVGAEHDNGELHGVAWYIDDSYEEATYGLSGSWDTDDWSRTFDDPGTYTVEADIFDAENVYNEESTSWTVTVEENEPVESWRDTPDEEITIEEGNEIIFTVGAEVSNGELLGAEWYINGGEPESTSAGLSGSYDTDSWAYTFDEPGEHIVEVSVFDEANEYSEEAVTWNVFVEEADSPGEVTVELVDQQTQPVEDIPVDISGPFGETGVTNSSGEVTFAPHEQRLYRISIHDNGVAESVLETIEIGEEDKTVTLEVTRAQEATIDGTVMTDTGEPADDVVVVLETRNGDLEAITDSDGTYAFDKSVVADRTYHVRYFVGDRPYKLGSLTPESGSNTYTTEIPAYAFDPDFEESLEQWAESDNFGELTDSIKNGLYAIRNSFSDDSDALARWERVSVGARGGHGNRVRSGCL